MESSSENSRIPTEMEDGVHISKSQCRVLEKGVSTRHSGPKAQWVSKGLTHIQRGEITYKLSEVTALREKGAGEKGPYLVFNKLN